MLSASADGTIVEVRVIPRAPRSIIAGVRDGALLVRLTAAPVDGHANAALLTVIADALGAPTRDVTLVSGERSRRKAVRVSGLTPADVSARLVVPTT